MMTMRRCVLPVVCSLSLLLACDGPTEPEAPTPEPAPEANKTIVPTPIPRGYDFPAERSTIEGWIQLGQLDAVRAHAWHLWAGLSADSEQKDSFGQTLPIWDTWLGTEEIFDASELPADRGARSFNLLAQAAHSGLPNQSAQLVSFNKYNPAMAAFLFADHPGVGGSYDYRDAQDLVDLNDAFNSAQTPTIDRQIAETPYTPPTAGAQGTAAMELKPVLNIVKKGHPTPVPLWRGFAGDAVKATGKGAPITQSAAGAQAVLCTGADPDTTMATDGPDHTHWTSCVILDPAGRGEPASTPLRPATAEEISAAKQHNVNGTDSCETFYYAPLSTAYSFKLTADEAAAYTKAGQAGAAAEGDFAVLMAMHVNTKEIKNWTWQTFWWQPGEDVAGEACRYDQDGITIDRPGATGCPGSKAGVTEDVRDEWRNYAMCTAYAEQDLTKTDQLATCYNPFLETGGIPDGVRSNCMSCHGTATATGPLVKGHTSSQGYPVPYDAPIGFGSGAPLDGPINDCFAAYARTDFSWAIQGNSTLPASGD